MVNDNDNGYSGPFYLEIDKGKLNDSIEIQDLLEELSSGVINNFERRGTAIYDFHDEGSAFKAVLILQQSNIPFTLTGEHDLVLLISD